MDAIELKAKATELGAEATDLGAEATELRAEATELRAEAADLRVEVTEFGAAAKYDTATEFRAVVNLGAVATKFGAARR